MQFQWGTPPEPGRYDCVFEDGTRVFHDILAIASDGTCIATNGSGCSLRLDRIVQYLGPFPDPLPKPEFPEPFRRFNVTCSDGRTGAGAYNPCGVDFPYMIRWSGDKKHLTYNSFFIADCKLEWIDEEPSD